MTRTQIYDRDTLSLQRRAAGGASAFPAPTTLPDGYLLEAQIGFLLRRAHQRHAALFQEAMGSLEFTPTQFTALAKVVECGAVTQNHLGRLTAMDPATIQGVVRRLINRGMLRRTTDPMDRRTIVLAATQTGQEYAARAVAIAVQVSQATLGPLSPAERDAVLSLLRQLA